MERMEGGVMGWLKGGGGMGLTTKVSIVIVFLRVKIQKRWAGMNADAQSNPKHCITPSH